VEFRAKKESEQNETETDVQSKITKRDLRMACTKEKEK
jgi:hypothetical protein